MTEPLISVQQAAALLGIPAKTLYAKTAARTVPFTKIGRHIRFTQEHLRQIVAAGEQPTATAPTRLQIASRRGRGRVA